MSTDNAATSVNNNNETKYNDANNNNNINDANKSTASDINATANSNVSNSSSATSNTNSNNVVGSSRPLPAHRQGSGTFDATGSFEIMEVPQTPASNNRNGNNSGNNTNIAASTNSNVTSNDTANTNNANMNRNIQVISNRSNPPSNPSSRRNSNIAPTNYNNLSVQYQPPTPGSGNPVIPTPTPKQQQQGGPHHSYTYSFSSVTTNNSNQPIGVNMDNPTRDLSPIPDETDHDMSRTTGSETNPKRNNNDNTNNNLSNDTTTKLNNNIYNNTTNTNKSNYSTIKVDTTPSSHHSRKESEFDDPTHDQVTPLINQLQKSTRSSSMQDNNNNINNSMQLFRPKPLITDSPATKSTSSNISVNQSTPASAYAYQFQPQTQSRVAPNTIESTRSLATTILADTPYHLDTTIRHNRSSTEAQQQYNSTVPLNASSFAQTQPPSQLRSNRSTPNLLLTNITTPTQSQLHSPPQLRSTISKQLDFTTFSPRSLSQKAKRIRELILEFDNKFLIIDPVNNRQYYPDWAIPYVMEMSDKLTYINNLQKQQQINNSSTEEKQTTIETSNIQSNTTVEPRYIIDFNDNLPFIRTNKYTKTKPKTSKITTNSYIHNNKTKTTHLTNSQYYNNNNYNDNINTGTMPIPTMYTANHQHYYANQKPLNKTNDNKIKVNKLHSAMLKQIDLLTQSLAEAWQVINSNKYNNNNNNNNDNNNQQYLLLLNELKNITNLYNQSNSRMEKLFNESELFKLALLQIIQNNNNNNNKNNTNNNDNTELMLKLQRDYEEKLKNQRLEYENQSNLYENTKQQLELLKQQLIDINNDKQKLINQLNNLNLANNNNNSNEIIQELTNINSTLRDKSLNDNKLLKKYEFQLVENNKTLNNLQDIINKLQQQQYDYNKQRELYEKQLNSYKVLFSKGYKLRNFVDKFMKFYYKKQYLYVLSEQIKLINTDGKGDLLNQLTKQQKEYELQLNQYNIDKNKLELYYKQQLDNNISLTNQQKQQLLTLSSHIETLELELKTNNIKINQFMDENKNLLLQLSVLGKNKIQFEYQDFMIESFKGDYINIMGDTKTLAALYKMGCTNIVFSDIVSRINSSNKSIKRIIIITDKAIYSCYNDNTRLIRRRMLINDINWISLSRLSADIFILHFNDKYDYYIQSSKRSEIMYYLLNIYYKLTGKQLEYKFGERMYVSDRDTISHRDVNITATNTVSIGKSSIFVPPGFQHTNIDNKPTSPNMLSGSGGNMNISNMRPISPTANTANNNVNNTGSMSNMNNNVNNNASMSSIYSYNNNNFNNNSMSNVNNNNNPNNTSMTNVNNPNNFNNNNASNNFNNNSNTNLNPNQPNVVRNY